MEPIIWIVVFMCLRTDPEKCEVWNMEYHGITWKGCREQAVDWSAAMAESSVYNVKHARCSLNRVEDAWLQ